jgi:hypothetical protein
VLGNGNLAALYLNLPLGTARTSPKSTGHSVLLEKGFPILDKAEGLAVSQQQKSFARRLQRMGNERVLRLFTINERAAALKGSPEPLLATGLIR